MQKSEERFNLKHKEVIDSILLSIEGVTQRTMFGYPAYFIHNKMIACLYQNGIGVKVSEEEAQKLLSQEHIIPFQPLGRPKMKNWIQINRDSSEDYRKDIDIFLLAIKNVTH